MSAPETTSIPRVVWTLWLQGWRHAPPVVRACLETWRAKNPGWTIHELTADTLDRHVDVRSALPGRDLDRIDRVVLSEVVRIALLRRHGGVWVDGTVYCNAPLDAWLPDRSASGFFAFANPGPDRLLSSWFLAAAPGNYLIEAWHRATLAYWANRATRDRYFWFHGLFGELYESDPVFRRGWDGARPLAAADAQRFVPYDAVLRGPLTEGLRRAIDEPDVPMFKLTHKMGKSVPKGSALAYLVKRTRAHGSMLGAIIETIRSRLSIGR